MKASGVYDIFPPGAVQDLPPSPERQIAWLDVLRDCDSMSAQSAPGVAPSAHTLPLLSPAGPQPSVCRIVLGWLLTICAQPYDTFVPHPITPSPQAVTSGPADDHVPGQMSPPLPLQR